MTRILRMFAISAVVAALGVAIACSDDDGVGPTNETLTFTAQLSPANEIPLVTNAEASGTGASTMLFRVNRDSGGAIASATVDFQAVLSNFPAGTILVAAHIHRGGVGVAGPIVLDTGLTSGEVVLTAGSGAFQKNGVSISAALAQEILSGPSGFYFNVHSTLNPTGVARGQLVRQ